MRVEFHPPAGLALATEVIVAWCDISGAGLQALASLGSKDRSTVTVLSITGLESNLPGFRFNPAIIGSAEYEEEPLALVINHGSEPSAPRVSAILLNTYVRQEQEIPVADALLRLIASPQGKERKLTLAGAMRMPSERGSDVLTWSMHRPLEPVELKAFEQLNGSTCLRDGFLAALVHLANALRIPTTIVLIPGYRPVSRGKATVDAEEIGAVMRLALCLSSVSKLPYTKDRLMRSIERRMVNLSPENEGGELMYT